MSIRRHDDEMHKPQQAPPPRLCIGRPTQHKQGDALIALTAAAPAAAAVVVSDVVMFIVVVDILCL